MIQLLDILLRQRMDPTAVFETSFGEEQRPFPVNGQRISRQLKGIAVPADKGRPFAFFQGAESLFETKNPGVAPTDNLQGLLFGKPCSEEPAGLDQ